MLQASQDVRLAKEEAITRGGKEERGKASKFIWINSV